MPKTLALLRHAKSARPEGVPDHERPLAGRGRRDAPAAGRWLRDHGPRLDLALVSTAVRARETFALVAAELPRPPRVVVTEEVYDASTGDLLDLARDLSPAVSAAVIVGHNPAIGTLAGLLDPNATAGLEFPTSAIAVFDVGATWSALDPGAARLVAYAVPRGTKG